MVNFSYMKTPPYSLVIPGPRFNPCRPHPDLSPPPSIDATLATPLLEVDDDDGGGGNGGLVHGWKPSW